MFKNWLLRTFFRKTLLLENILIELRNLHHHFSRLESFYMIVNNIEENGNKIIIGDIIIDKNQEIGKK